MCVAQPWTIPSSRQLLVALRKYESLSSVTTGRVTKDQYMDTSVWLDEGDDIRNGRIKEVSWPINMCRVLY